jgi:hypothetical protein
MSSVRLSPNAFLPGRACNALVVPPSPMMYPPCPPWVGWYEPWAPLPMHLHAGRSGPVEGFDHRGYFIEDGHYGFVGHQHDSRTPSQENQMVQNLKPDGLVSS